MSQIRRVFWYYSYLTTQIGNLLSFIPYRVLYSIVLRKSEQRFFVFNGKRLRYFFHSYNNFMITERCVEIPIVKSYLEDGRYGAILEIGNVTKHYYADFQLPVPKDTVDKYEKSYDVSNVDIRDYRADRRYDFIYSISTFEHMDTDGNRNQEYVPRAGSSPYSSYAFEYMKRVFDGLLADGGKLVITVPLGYCNGEVDRGILEREYERIGAERAQVFILKRTRDTTWKQVDRAEFERSGANPLFPVSYLCVLELDKPKSRGASLQAT